jgi:hypothetical protein
MGGNIRKQKHTWYSQEVGKEAVVHGGLYYDP